MEHKCETCKFKQKRIFDAPCNTCSVIWASDDGTDNWQPAKPKRKDLQEQLDAANQRIAELVAQCNEIYKREEEVTLSLTQAEYGFTVDQEVTNSMVNDLKSQLDAVTAQLTDLQQRYDALKDCYLVHEEPGDSAHSMVVDFGKVLIEHEEELTHANAEIDSMHRELKTKDAENADVWKQLSARNADIADLHQQLEAKNKEIAEHRRHLSKVMQRDADAKAIIAEQNRELDEVKEKLRLMEIENRALRTKIWLIKWARLE